MKPIALYNISGGVGKTSLTKELGYGLAQAGKRVLLIDLDPQASLTTFLGMAPNQGGPEPDPDRPTLYQCLMHGSDLSPVLKAQTKDFDWGVDLIPSGPDLERAEPELVIADMREMRLRNLIAPYESSYDYVLIDCQGSTGMLPYIALAAATHALIPIQTGFKAVHGTNEVLRMLARIKKGPNRNLAIAAFVPTMYDKRQTLHRDTLDFIKTLSSVAPIMLPINMVALAERSTYERKPMAAICKRKEEAELRALNAIEALTQHILSL